MSAQPEDPHPSAAEIPEKDLKAIRAALVVPQDLEAFDASLKAVLDEVREKLDISPLNEFLHIWWLTARDSAQDPEGRRLMWEAAEKIIAGEAPQRGRDPWELLAERQRAVR